MRRTSFGFHIFAALMAGALVSHISYAGNISGLTEFKDKSAANAAEVNGNFIAIQNAVNENNAKLDSHITTDVPYTNTNAEKAILDRLLNLSGNKAFADQLTKIISDIAKSTITANAPTLKVPVATIVASTLDEVQFAKEMGEDNKVKPLRLWVLADGVDITGSDYAAITGRTKVPDLRGMFLRGLNVGRSDGLQDPDNARVLGSYQSDLFASHNHNNGAFNILGITNQIATTNGTAIDNIGLGELNLSGQGTGASFPQVVLKPAHAMLPFTTTFALITRSNNWVPPYGSRSLDYPHSRVTQVFT